MRKKKRKKKRKQKKREMNSKKHGVFISDFNFIFKFYLFFGCYHAAGCKSNGLFEFLR